MRFCIEFKIKMGFGNISYCAFKYCSCIDFGQDFLNLWLRILTVEDDLQQWAIFEGLKRHLRSYRSVIRCDLFNNYSEILHRIHKHKGNGLTLSFLLRDLLTVIYTTNFGKVIGDNMKDYQEIPFICCAEIRRLFGIIIAFDTNLDLMKLLLHFNFLSSLPEENFSLQFLTSGSFTEFK